MAIVYLSLGSNIGDRVGYIKQATKLLTEKKNQIAKKQEDEKKAKKQEEIARQYAFYQERANGLLTNFLNMRWGVGNYEGASKMTLEQFVDDYRQWLITNIANGTEGRSCPKEWIEEFVKNASSKIAAKHKEVVEFMAERNKKAAEQPKKGEEKAEDYVDGFSFENAYANSKKFCDASKTFKTKEKFLDVFKSRIHDFEQTTGKKMPEAQKKELLNRAAAQWDKDNVSSM